MSRSATTALFLLAGLLVIGLTPPGLFPRAPRAGATAVPSDGGQKAAARALGYSAAFDAELRKIGHISPQAFAQRYPGPANYLARLDGDPTTAKFWDAVNADPSQGSSPRGGRADFRLNAQELKVFKQNGFVVSERLGAASFAEMFYRIYSRDLPVYISADALLHAWHSSYDSMLEELEQGYLAESLDEVLAGMAR
jgi:hypothetical protein